MLPVIYTAENHRIDHEKINRDALTVLQTLVDAGYTAYLVGGGVRDLLAGVTPKDFDVSTDARPEEIKKLFRRRCILVGRRFRLAHIRFGKHIIEVSTFRAGDDAERLITQDNTWGTPEQDVLRRDFTINGLYYDPTERCVIDFVGGMEDIQRHLMRSIGDPVVRFRQDPVRMIRLLKFKARFGFHVEDSAEAALNECKAEIVKSAPARILEEILRMLESGASKPFFDLMTENGIMELLIPDLAKYLRSSKGHRIYRFLEAADRVCRDQSLALDRSILCACLCFPILEDLVEKNFSTEEDSPNVEQLGELCSDLIRSMMGYSFCNFPKRLRALTTMIMMWQYRLTPIHSTQKPKNWLVRNQDSQLALTFLYLRSQVDTDLKRVYAKWHDLYYKAPAVRKRRRRRSRSKKA